MIIKPKFIGRHKVKVKNTKNKREKRIILTYQIRNIIKTRNNTMPHRMYAQYLIERERGQEFYPILIYDPEGYQVDFDYILNSGVQPIPIEPETNEDLIIPCTEKFNLEGKIILIGTGDKIEL